jgi:hypothetical protein
MKGPLSLDGAIVKITCFLWESGGMSWKDIKLHSGGKLFKVHNFTYMIKGVTYQLEIDEFIDGTFTGHGEHSTDRNSFVESVSGKSVDDCLTHLVARIGQRLGL